jgi:hypothetical protein
MPIGAHKVDRATRIGNPFTDKGTIHRRSLLCWGWKLPEPPALAHTPAEAVALFEHWLTADDASLTRVTGFGDSISPAGARSMRLAMPTCCCVLPTNNWNAPWKLPSSWSSWCSWRAR